MENQNRLQGDTDRPTNVTESVASVEVPTNSSEAALKCGCRSKACSECRLCCHVCTCNGPPQPKRAKRGRPTKAEATPKKTEPQVKRPRSTRDAAAACTVKVAAALEEPEELFVPPGTIPQLENVKDLVEAFALSQTDVNHLPSKVRRKTKPSEELKNSGTSWSALVKLLNTITDKVATILAKRASQALRLAAAQAFLKRNKNLIAETPPPVDKNKMMNVAIEIAKNAAKGSHEGRVARAILVKGSSRRVQEQLSSDKVINLIGNTGVRAYQDYKTMCVEKKGLTVEKQARTEKELQEMQERKKEAQQELEQTTSSLFSVKQELEQAEARLEQMRREIANLEAVKRGLLANMT